MNHTIEKILANCPKCSMPGNLVPMALTLTKDPFNHKDWQFEIKWDGFRMLHIVLASNSTLLEAGDAQQNISGNDWTYIATTANNPLAGSRIKVIATDVPANEGTLEVTL